MLLDYDADQTDALSDVGPIIAAFVDGGLTVVHGELGTTRFPTAIVSRETPPAEPEPVNIVRAPDADAQPVAIGQPMVDDTPRVEPVERFTESFVKSLMRHKVEGGEGPLGGGGGGRRRTKPPKRQPIREVVDDEKPGNVPMGFKVSGLTAGEEEYYLARDGEALRVARETVGSIITAMRDGTTFAEPTVRPQRGDLRYNFTMWAETEGRDGLKEPEIRILAKFRGALRRALIQNAHMVDGPRVKSIDGIAAAPGTKNAFGTVIVR